MALIFVCTIDVFQFAGGSANLIAEESPVIVPLPAIIPKQFRVHCEFMTWSKPGMKECAILIKPNATQSDSYSQNERINDKVNIMAQ